MRTILLTCASVICLASFGQHNADSSSTNTFAFKNSVQVDLFGHGGFYSLNYERLLINKNKTKTLLRAGLSLYPQHTTSSFLMPVSLNELISFKSHHLELGAGMLYMNNGGGILKNHDLFGTFTLGYRYQKPGSHFMYKAAFTPIINANLRWGKAEAFPWGGFTFGYNF